MGYNNCLNDVPKESCKEHTPDSSEEFAKAVKVLECISYPYLQAQYCCHGQPLSFHQSLEPKGLSKENVDKVLERKRSLPSSSAKDSAGPTGAPSKRAKTMGEAVLRY